MLTTQSNTWRRSGQANNRQNQDRSSGTNTPTRDGGRQQAMAALSGNAWNSGKGKAASAGGDKGAASAPVHAEQHVPVQDFNAGEVKEYLKKRYLESVGDQPSVYHKVQGDSVDRRGSGAWGSRGMTLPKHAPGHADIRAGNMSHLMPSGKDFFTQLRKQLQTFEQGKSS
ncbi:hypothetical protein BCR34DRAFT_488326 [Clohesyomyces aquaticus]|uniref:Uncharacterized protein n=1 Tax=Clohesyomyces aquaticus TaxID=1231657 RepID=A0A1Y1ZEK4_9PLEO|nr:hypothetical protein BCR34DRAFT_488326 [Clohesyomyces aquaticus]